MPIISILGGQGTFGTRLAEHLRRVASTAQLRITDDKLHNLNSAAGADIIFITVRPLQVPDVLQEIRGVLSPTTIVVSCAAAVPFAALVAATGRPVVRLMMDPDARFGIIASPNSLDHQLLDLFQHMLTHPPRIATTDNEVDHFTASLGAFFVASTWGRAVRDDADVWVMPHLRQASAALNVNMTVVEQEYRLLGSKEAAAKKLKSYATHGGISTLLSATLEAYPLTAPEALVDIALTRINELKNRWR